MCVRALMCLRECVNVCVCIYVHARACACTRACLSVHVSPACLRVCVCVHARVCAGCQASTRRNALTMHPVASNPIRA